MNGFTNITTDYGADGNLSDRDALVMEYLPQVQRIVQRIAAHLPPNIDREDLINSGIIGLIQSAERFDSSHANTFMTYAQTRIRGAVISELRARDYLSRQTRRNLRELEDTYARLEQELGGDVTDEALAEAMELSLEDVYEIRSRACLSFVCLEDLGLTNQQDKASVLKEMAGSQATDPYEMTQLKDVHAALKQAIEKLPEKERLIVSLYYGDELTMKEIGRVLDVSESRVSQIHTTAVFRLRKQLRLQGHIVDDQ
jgi:RNA polymerase sigma factor for flagellar operon FliA